MWTINSCEKQLKDKSVRKTNTRKCLACSAWLLAYLKLSKKMARPWIGSANFIFYLFLLCPVSSETVLHRCFKEYFSLKISQENFRNFIINLQVKGNVQFVQKMTFKPLIDFKQNYYPNRKCYKSCYF